MPNTLRKIQKSKRISTLLIKVNSQKPARRAIQQAVSYLKNGEVVAFPTETVYGLAVSSNHLKAIKKLYTAKARSFNKPVAYLIHSRKQAESLCGQLPLPAKKLMKSFWPGPLTIVLPGKNGKPETVGLRFADHVLALKISRAYKEPLLLTSANLSGENDACSAGEVLRQLDGRIPLVLDGGRVNLGKPSTVWQWTAQGGQILRQGVISSRQIERVLKRA